ncbi:MAG: phosphoribosylformylglycinamidine synthase I [Dehalococcoidia bacterium]|nr:phosphoribosylformylglycinamidine synthase I [Dehalococcoidia bacterium]
MKTPRILVLRAPGTNCDHETAFAFELAGGAASLVHIERLLERTTTIEGFQIFVIPGGFSYGDDLGSGKIVANEIELRLREQLADFVGRGGLVLGICNGFQVLVRAGLLPTVSSRQSVSLLPNVSGRFECRWVHMRTVEGSPCIFTRGMDSLELGVAHGEGRLFVPEDVRAQVFPALRYVNPDGGTVTYPHNPNGSCMDIAGLSDPSGQIFGLMPHPERFVRALQHPSWTRGSAGDGNAAGAGLQMFVNAVDYARQLA